MKKLYVCILAHFLVGMGVIHAQVTGKVTDASTQEPLVSVNVLIQGTTTGTLTDLTGSFTLTADQGSTLVFSIVGYGTLEVEVTGDFLEVALQEVVTNLEEVVVSGLASSIKRQNTAHATATVSSKELTGSTGQSTLDGALYGKLTGVNIVSASGAPGGGFSVRLRGVSSIRGNNQPLYVLDGVYISNIEIPNGSRLASGARSPNEENAPNRLADINPNDIASVEVLKGASAAAVYGTRANAGVVIINTKRGTAGSRVAFSQDVGVSTISNRPGVRTWTAEKVESEINAEERAKFEQAQQAGKIYNYEDILYGERGLITDSRLSVTGGNQTTNFYTALGYRNEGGIVQNTGFNRLSVRANINHKINDFADINTSSNYIRSTSDRLFSENENSGGLSLGYSLAFTRPWVDLFPDENNGVYPDNPSYAGNPLFVRDRAINNDENNRFIQGVGVNIHFLKTNTNYLRGFFNGGIDYLANKTYVYVPEEHQAQRGNDNGFIAEGRNNFTNFNYITGLSWDLYTLNSALSFSTQAGISYLGQQSNSVLGIAKQLVPGQTVLGQSASQELRNTRQRVQELGYFGQLEVNYRDQIIATGGYRVDKSTLNGDPNKLYGFPRASLAVNISQFDFFTTEQCY